MKVRRRERSVMVDQFPIQEVVDLWRWRKDGYGDEWRFPLYSCTMYKNSIYFHAFPLSTYPDVERVKELYDLKIGEVGCYWDPTTHQPIDYRYAKIKLGDVFDYYTKDGILIVPKWANFKYAVDEYLENAPQIKYHPDRVQEFIEKNGIDQVEHM